MPQFQSEKDLVSFVIGKKLPEWQRKLFKKYAEAVQVHSQGEIFYKLNTLFPNEHPESKKNRILAFESVTEASFGRAANNVNRIFKNSSYTVEASEKVLQYTSEHTFDGMNFFAWFLDEWVKFALKQDANSRIVVYPPEYVEKYGTGPVVFIESCHIKYLSNDMVIFISEKESVVDYEIEEVHVWSETFYDQTINRPNFREARENTYTPKMKATFKKYVYHVFMKDFGLIRISQTEDAKEYDIEEFEFKQEFLPVIDAGGEKSKHNVNKSFLNPFVSFGNLALLQHSQHTAVNFTFSFPRMSEIQTPCDAEGCQNGQILCETEADQSEYGDRKYCGKCGGSGYTRNQTPYKVYVKQYDPQGLESDNKHLDVDDVKYYTPDTSILEYSKSEWKDYLEMAETAVYISQRVATGNVESAESKQIDRDDMYSFLTKVGQCFFQRLRFVLQCFENYMIASPVQVSVEIPYSYAILSESEAFTALKDILSSNVPVMLKASQVDSFVNKFISQSSPVRKFIDVLKVVDPLLYYTNAEIAGFKANMIVTPEQFAVHVFAFPTLQNMFFNDKDLFAKDTNQIVATLKKDLEQYKPEPVKDLKTKLLEQQQQGE